MSLFVESGTLVVHVDQPSWVQKAGRTDDPGQKSSSPPGLSRSRSVRGSPLARTQATRLRSIGSEAAVVLSAATLAGDGGPTNRWVQARTLDEILFPRGQKRGGADKCAHPVAPGVRAS